MGDQQGLKVMVLAGGPDRERPVSLASGAQVAAALAEVGHEVRQCDIVPDDLRALEQFQQWPGDVIFPVLHGAWGEGGGLQRHLDELRIPYVGSGAPASALCMDKHRTKLVLQQHLLPTPEHQLLGLADQRTIPAPVVLKATHEGSSIDLFICHNDEAADHAQATLRQHHARFLVERYVPGKELTVAIIGTPGRGRTGYVALPSICIVPAEGFYDYQAKYHRTDTRYLFDPQQIGLPAEVLEQARQTSLAAHKALGCRHLSRVDLIVDHQHKLWILEINTMPGFTSHSLVPMAAAKAGIPLPQLVDRLVRLPLSETPPV